MDRRTELVSAASDHVAEHGLIGLSLRPLAAAIGTSDRMLLYHFESKDDLVAAILEHSSGTALEELAGLEPRADVRAAVLDLWQQLRAGRLATDYRVYIEAAAMGLLGREPYRSVIRAGNREWRRTLARYFAGSGATSTSAARVAALVDAALMGLFLDLPLDDDPLVERTVRDLADAAAALSGAG